MARSVAERLRECREEAGPAGRRVLADADSPGERSPTPGRLRRYPPPREDASCADVQGIEAIVWRAAKAVLIGAVAGLAVLMAGRSLWAPRRRARRLRVEANELSIREEEPTVGAPDTHALERRLREAERLNEANAVVLEAAIRTRNSLLAVMREYGLPVGVSGDEAARWLQQRLRAVQATVTELETTRRELDDLRALIGQHAAVEGMGAEQVREWLRARLEELERARQQNEELRREAAAAAAERDALRRELAEARKEGEELRREVAHVRQENEHLRQEAARAHHENETLREEAMRVRREVERVRNQVREILGAETMERI